MNVSALSLRDLEYVVAVDEDRHFGRAALRCNVSQPALSSQIRKLEEALDVALFERTSRRVIPTAAGSRIVRQARTVLEEAARLIALAASDKGDAMTGRLALGAIQTLGPYLFPLILRGLRSGFPGLVFALSEARTAELVDGLREGRIDAAIVSPPVDDAGLTLLPVFAEPLVVACPADHPLASRTAIGPDDLGGSDLLLLDEGNCLRDQAIAACDAGSTAGRHATSLETLRSMVAAGSGYTLIPALAVPPAEGEAAAGDPLLVYRPLSEGGGRLSREIALAFRSTDPRGPTFHALARHLSTHAPPGTIAGTGKADEPGRGGDV